MTRAIIVIFITALLGGCVVLPLDYGYRGGHGHRTDGYSRGDGDGRDWDHHDRDRQYRR